LHYNNSWADPDIDSSDWIRRNRNEKSFATCHVGFGDGFCLCIQRVCWCRHAYEIIFRKPFRS